MKIYSFEEPLLEFANDSHVCPRFGIAHFETYDSQPLLFDTKPKDIVLGIIGTQQTFEKFGTWLKLCSDFIEGKPDSNKTNLFTSFCGFNEHGGFRSRIVYSLPYFRQINDTDLDKIVRGVKKIGRQTAIKEVAELYLQNIRFLAQNKTPQVIVCLIPQKVYTKVLGSVTSDEIDDEGETTKASMETNFHHLLKAKAMQYKIPIQIILETTLSTEPPPPGSKSDLQDIATRAWNLCTALYYKAGGIAWKAYAPGQRDLTCFVGISFYKTLDKKSLQTSLAQIFDEQGKGVILRGSPAQIDQKGDRQPHLTELQAHELLVNAIDAYKFAESVSPKRVVIHKSSKYTDQEMEGFRKAIEDKGISTFDFVAVLESDVRLFRNGSYPPLRGTCLELAENKFLMYSKGSVSFYQTYAGMYVPHPIDIGIEALNSSPRIVCEEILSLTKMNWNNTQFDRRMPITVDCSRSVGSILKYVEDDRIPEMKYSFYM